MISSPNVLGIGKSNSSYRLRECPSARYHGRVDCGWVAFFSFFLFASAALAQNPTCPTRPLGDNSNACASTSFTQSALPALTVTAQPFGADPTGTNDSTTAIQGAINALPVTGGDILFPAGTYKISSTLNIGNGTGAAVSTRYGVRLLGVGVPVEPVGFATYPTTPVVKLLWNGAAAGTLLKINGPLQGWGIQNLLLDCASSANIGLNVISGQYGDVRNFVAINCETWGISSVTVSPFGGTTFTGAHHNRYDNVTITVPAGAVGGGILLSGTTTANTLFNQFTNTTIAIAGSTQNGLYLQAAAGNYFSLLHITGAVGITNIVFDYNVNSSWPANNTIDTIEPGVGTTLALNTGSPGAGARPNYLRNLITTDGATYPTLANLVTDGGQAFASQTNDAANTGNVGEIVSSTVLVGSAVSLVSGTPKTVTSISLTAGDWDVAASIGYTGGSTTTLTQVIASISATNNTLDGSDTRATQNIYTGTTIFNTGNPQFAAGPSRFSLSATTTIFLVADAVFGVSTCSAFGTIRARRVR